MDRHATPTNCAGHRPLPKIVAPCYSGCYLLRFNIVTEDQYARRALSELVLHVLSKRARPIEGLNYKDLAFRIGRRDKNGEGVGIGMGRILGKMGHILQQLEPSWGKQIPQIQSLVIDKTGKNRGLPADGIDEFWPNYTHLTRAQKQLRVRQEYRRILAFGSRWNEVLKRSNILPATFWVVSPNVRNDEQTVGAWRRASVSGRVAFMGYGPNDLRHGGIGPTFADSTKRGIKPGDIILIARRHCHKPDIVGFGVVHGKFATRINGVNTPESFGALRRLRPFTPWSRPPPSDVPIIDVIRHTKALAKLHPESNKAHRKVCAWIEQHIQKKSPAQKLGNPAQRPKGQDSTPLNPHIVSSPENHQLDYKLQTKAKLIRAMKVEAALLESYRSWLQLQDRNFATVKYKTLQCDAFEEHRRNLIEAKSSASREHIRMAVGQLLDYAFQGREKFADPHKAILLPTEPPSDIVHWLDSLGIKVIWYENAAFLDNANGQFT
jgi:hypothetical protein